MEGLDVSRTFWRGKRVFVTGHTGFKGSWLCRWLLRNGADVTGYALDPPTTPNLFQAMRLDRDIRSICPADVRDASRLRAALVDNRPDIVFHLAAQALVAASYAQPMLTYETNVTGTADLLEAVRACPNVRAVVVVTSDKCYDSTDPNRRHGEDDPLGGRDPYSASKACAELVVAAYRSSFFSTPKRTRDSSAAVATARAGNVIGGGDWAPHRLIPDAVTAFASHAPLRLRNPGAIRPWQHVLDPLYGYLLLARALHDEDSAFAAAWNFGPRASHEISVENLVREFARAWGEDVTWQADPGSRVFDEAESLRLDSTRAERDLHWRVSLPLADAITGTAHWYQSYRAGAPALELVDADIDAFEDRIA